MRRGTSGGESESCIRHPLLSVNRDISGFSFNFMSLRPFLTIFNNQNKCNQFNQNQFFLHQIYPRGKNIIQKR